MSRRSEMIAQAQVQAESSVVATAEKVLRPTINFPESMTLWSPSYYDGSSGKQPQVSGWSHELQMFVRIFGDLATKIAGAHNRETGEALFQFARVNGEEQLRADGKPSKGKPITLEIRPNGNGLLFEPTEEFPNAYASANEAAIARVKPGVPDTMIG